MTLPVRNSFWLYRRVPQQVFCNSLLRRQDSFKQGDKLGLNICVNVGSQHVGDKKRGQIEWSQGCGGGKDATKFGKVTLGEQIKIPVATTTKAAATTAAKAAATAAAAKTADASVIIAAVATIALAGVVVCRKKH